MNMNPPFPRWLVALLPLLPTLLQAAQPPGQAELASIAVQANADAVTFAKSATTLVVTAPAAAAHTIDTDLDWTTRREGGRQVVELRLPPESGIQFFTYEENGRVVLKLLRRTAGKSVATAQEPQQAPPEMPKPAIDPKTPAPALAPAAIPPGAADLLAQILGKQPGEVKFDPANRTDFELPRVPAAAAIGSKAETIRPTTPRLFAIELLSKVGDNGTINPGFAFAVAPYLMLQDVPLNEYRRAESTRFLSRLQLSLASAKAGEKRGNDGVVVSAALSGLIFDFGDPRRAEELDGAFKTIFPAEGLPAFTGGERPTMESEKTNAWSKTVDNWNRANWNKARMGFGYAPRWFSPTGKTDDLKSDGGVGWLALALPGYGRFAENIQLVSSLQYRHGEMLPLPASPATLHSAEALSAGAQVRFGSAQFNGYAEAFWNRMKFSGGPKNTAWSYELGAEKRLTPSLWLQFSAGRGRTTTGEQTTDVKSGFRYAFGDGPQLKLKD